MIRFENVTKEYDEETVAVRDITFEIPSRELTVLIGPSGCGKTTTLKMINRIVKPSGGRILIDGEDVKDMNVKSLRRGIGYVIQNVGLFPHMSVKDNIATVPKLLKWERSKIERRVSELLELVGLEPKSYANKLPKELSGGEAQRVGVARALAADPPIILMDEPFGAVDPLTRVRLQDEFARIQEELHKTIVFVTHDIDEAIRLADRIAVMKAGRILQLDTPEEILARPKEKFVHDFIGSDRALKRLSRIPVMEYIEKCETIEIDGGWDQLGMTKEEFIWALDEDRKLVGWVDVSHSNRELPLREALTEMLEEEILSPDSTVKEALSRMLESGTVALPVVERSGRFLGQISLSKIQELTRSDREE
ncbi:ABC transporter ATP-binding protein [Mesotoga prima]|uniref:ABC transporter ATP-binding protein n=1 Tax=Mesotoga prima TaxID=1184387 RepID=UPI002BFD6CB3|nr:ABC transporter ATP-binding protein [Mesotoga prima]HNQ71486.1 ABC transporter ATP-binding protein [Mesotoga prima]HNS76510.1 ABC transporter ATP-binding protein [Mesotoga prima]